MLKDMVEKMDNTHEEMGNFSEEGDTVKMEMEPNGNDNTKLRYQGIPWQSSG